VTNEQACAPNLIRFATSADAEAIAHLVNSAYRGDSSRAGWTTEADLLGGQRTDVAAVLEFLQGSDPLQRVLPLLLHSDSTLLACLQLERDGAEGYLGQFAVSPTRQGAGLGRTLLSAAEEHARSHWHCQTMRMTVLEQRPELLAWYARCGYLPTGETVAFPYDDIRCGEPRRPDLRLRVLRKPLA